MANTQTQSWPVIDPFVQMRKATRDDIDEFGHVNNLRYVAWAMDIAWAHTNALGLSFDDYRRIGVGCVVWRHEFDYLGAVLEGDEVAVATWIASTDRRVRMTRAFEMRRPDDTLVFRGVTKFVTIDMTSGKPTRMPKEFLEAYRPAEEKQKEE
ncbi:MAG: thioesterase family protein [Pseudomonadota bacterium]